MTLKKYVEPTSKITRIAFEHGAHLVNLNDETSSKFGEIGSSLGNAAYCIDATEDLSSDMLKNNFNPIIANDKITIDHLIKKTNQHCDIMIDNIANLSISNQFKSRYLLQLAALKAGDKNKKKEKNNKGSIFDGCDCSCCEICTDWNCSNDGCCNSSDSSCCESGCEGCCECSCDGCCDC